MLKAKFNNILRKKNSFKIRLNYFTIRFCDCYINRGFKYFIFE